MKNTIYLFFILIIGAAVRFYELTEQSLWADETFIANSLKLSTPVMLKSLWYHENHPPLYLFIMKGWSSIFGTEDLSLRAFSVLIGVLSIFYFYRLVSLLWNEKVALVSASLLAISPFAVYYSQEVRHYGLWFLLTCASFYYYFQCLLFGKKCYFRWALFTVLCLYTHIYAIFIYFIQGTAFLWALFQKNEKGRENARSCLGDKTFWLAILLLLLASSPMAWWVSMRVRHDLVGFDKSFSLIHFIYTPFVWVFGYSLGPSVDELHVISAHTVISKYWMIISPAIALIFIVAFTGLYTELKTGRIAFFWLLAGLALVLIVASPLYTYVYYNVRSTVFLVPFFYALLGIGTLELTKFRGLFILPLAMAALMLFSLAQYFHNPVYFRDDVRDVARILSKSPPSIPILTGRMLAERDVSHYYDTSHQTFLRFEFVTPEELEQYPQIWLIKNRMWLYNDDNRLLEFLKKNYKVEKEYQYPGVEAELLKKKQLE